MAFAAVLVSGVCTLALALQYTFFYRQVLLLASLLVAAGLFGAMGFGELISLQGALFLVFLGALLCVFVLVFGLLVHRDRGS